MNAPELAVFTPGPSGRTWHILREIPRRRQLSYALECGAQVSPPLDGITGRAILMYADERAIRVRGRPVCSNCRRTRDYRRRNDERPAPD